MVNREVRCRCGQRGVITGVEQAAGEPALVWVTHQVRTSLQTHIHRSMQLPAIMAQLTD